MKKILTLIAAFAFVATASAQVLMSNDFEDGTAGTWKVWENKEASIVGADKAKDSKHAIELFTGGYCDVKGVQAGSTYVASADVKCTWSEHGGILRIQGYDPKAKKLVTVKEVALPSGNSFSNVKLSFKAKYGGYYRFAITPEGGSSFKYIVDNMKVEKVE